jgi:hypothetical protein
MKHNITLIKWFHLPLILTSLRQINVKVGIVLLKDGKHGGNPLREELRSSAID